MLQRLTPEDIERIIEERRRVCAQAVVVEVGTYKPLRICGPNESAGKDAADVETLTVFGAINERSLPMENLNNRLTEDEIVEKAPVDADWMQRNVWFYRRMQQMDMRTQPDPLVISDSAFITGIVLAGLSIVAVLVWVLR